MQVAGRLRKQERESWQLVTGILQVKVVQVST